VTNYYTPTTKSSASSGSYRVYSPGSGKKEESPFGEFVAGVVLICVALPMVWMNERKQVKTYKTIERGRKDVVRNVFDRESDHLNNWKFVHIRGDTTTDKPLADDIFAVQLD
jgi:hypothetical protein